MGRVRTAVIGVGSMGRNHVRVLSRMDDVELVGIVDSDRTQAQRVAAEWGVDTYEGLDLLPEVDFAVVAVPTVAHVEVAEHLLGRGVSLLVEKPLAPTPDDAERMVALAEAQGVLLAVGHIERYNPVVTMLSKLVEHPRLMQFSRLSPYTPRVTEGVVFDLMVHDLDLACFLAGASPVGVAAAGARVVSDTLDVATASLTFADGCVAAVTASRITQDKVRRIAISEVERYFDADCLRQELSVKRETHAEFIADAVYQQASTVEIPYLDRRAEPLALELRNVIDAIRGNDELGVDGRAGADAVRLAYAVEQMAAEMLQ